MPTPALVESLRHWLACALPSAAEQRAFSSPEQSSSLLHSRVQLPQRQAELCPHSASLVQARSQLELLPSLGALPGS
jgi:hypothetical protein